jgi:ferredoxin--NADP+ reductase
LVADFNAGKLIDPMTKPEALAKLVRARRPEVVDSAGWRAIDAAEIARGSDDGRPRNKFIDVADMLAAAATAQPAPPLRRRLAARLRDPLASG